MTTSSPADLLVPTRMRPSLLLLGAQKTTCGACGRIHSGWYDRKLRRARDLPAGHLRIVLESRLLVVWWVLTRHISPPIRFAAMRRFAQKHPENVNFGFFSLRTTQNFVAILRLSL